MARDSKAPASAAGASVDSLEATVRAAVEAVRAGDREAFAAIVEVFGRRLFNLALMMTRDVAGAEEVTQDALVRAFLNVDAFDVRRPLYPWLATIAVRQAQTWLVRKARVRTREGAELVHDHLASPARDMLTEIITDEGDRRLWRAVASLSAGERTAVLLFYRHELPVRDIAAALGVTEGTVKTLLFRARRHLRQRLESSGDETPWTR